MHSSLPAIEPLEMTAREEEEIKADIQNKGMVIFTVTWYGSPDDLRLRMCLNTIRECRERSIAVVVVDDSPSVDVRSALRTSGAVVRRQTVPGKKGVALREAATIARRLPGVTSSTYLCWQEAEKTDMVRHWTEILDDGKVDVVVPFRNLESFRETYPIEQYHEEMFGNRYLDAIAARHLYGPNSDPPPRSDFASDGGAPRLDWCFGPIGFRAGHAELWTEYRGGDSYDAQVVPLVHALRRGVRVSSREIEYRAPSEMQAQEEGDIPFIEKRLGQLNDLCPKVKASWTQPFYC